MLFRPIIILYCKLKPEDLFMEYLYYMFFHNYLNENYYGQLKVKTEQWCRNWWELTMVLNYLSIYRDSIFYDSAKLVIVCEQKMRRNIES